MFPITERDDHDIAYMEDDIELELDFVLGEAFREVLDELDPPKMKPASKIAIEGLENVKIDENSGAVSCSVCFEEISIGIEAKRLPCSHVYHAGCIVKWLNERNTCPLCRYQMPVVDFDLNLPIPGLVDSDGDYKMTAVD
ncbi:hypothetical protein REPUB_Repub07fG0196200 [Reevesia pubescens]